MRAVAASRRLLALAAATLLAAAFGAPGCAGEPAAPPTSPAPPTGEPPPAFELPEDPDALFLVIWQGPGFAPIEYVLGRPPLHALSVDGDLWSEGPIPEIYPGPLLPSILHAGISSADVAAVVERIVEIGLHEVEDERIEQPASGPVLADAPALSLTLTDRRGLRTLWIDAYWSEYHQDPRVELARDLLGFLHQAGMDAGNSEWAGDRLQVYAGPGQIFDSSVISYRPWPLPEPPPNTSGFECQIYEGPVAADLLEEFRSANHGVRWRYEADLYQILARPLIPGEVGCER